jgi:hypothetical protein
MKKSPDLTEKRQRVQRVFLMGSVLGLIVLAIGLWNERDLQNVESSSQQPISTDGKRGFAKGNEKASGVNEAVGGNEITEMMVPSNHRQPLSFRAKAVEPAAVLGVLASGKQTVDERVGQLRGMRGIVLSKEERLAAVEFLAGRNVPEGMGKGSMHWLADELMTVLRLQEPPQEGLAAELGNVAFQPGTDPVVRDYLMQHLGHLWEQFGARAEIEKSLWQAVVSSDETTPGTALIALSRGYQRDQQRESLTTVQQRAFMLAANSNSPLAVRVTALSIAGESGGADVQALANRLLEDPTTPLILRKVAERVGK